MNELSAHPRTRGLSTTELVVTAAVLVLLSALALTGLSRARLGRSQAVCAANLHTIGVALAAYAADYDDNYPVPTPAAQWEELLRRYVHRKTFCCPGDQELFPQLGSSYDWRDTGNSITTLVGKSRLQVGRADTAVVFDALPGWHGKDQIQLLQADMAVRLVGQDAFFADLQKRVDR
jgi:hypothetical protein